MRVEVVWVVSVGDVNAGGDVIAVFDREPTLDEMRELPEAEFDEWGEYGIEGRLEANSRTEFLKWTRVEVTK